MNNFTYDIPTRIHFGKGQISALAGEVKRYGGKALLLYGGGSIKKNGIYDDVCAALREGGIAWEELSGIDPNPRYTSVDAGVKLCREKHIDVLLPVGGGSTIDCAKVISASMDHQGSSWDIMTKKAAPGGFLPIVAVLTISATGSEMDNGAVITNMDTNQKLFLAHQALRPKAAILDPAYTYSVSKYQTASGTADIFSHVQETYFSPVSDFYMLDRLCEGLLKTCVHYGKIAVEHPDNYEARANLMWASSWGINDMIGLGKRGAWTAHPIEHQLSAYFDIPHGVGLAIVTPALLRYYLNEQTVDKFVEYAVNVFGIAPGGDKFAIANKGIEATYDFFASMGIPMRLRELGITEDKLETMANSCGDLPNAYVPMKKADVLALLKEVF